MLAIVERATKERVCLYLCVCVCVCVCYYSVLNSINFAFYKLCVSTNFLNNLPESIQLIKGGTSRVYILPGTQFQTKNSTIQAFFFTISLRQFLDVQIMDLT